MQAATVTCAANLMSKQVDLNVLLLYAKLFKHSTRRRYCSLTLPYRVVMRFPDRETAAYCWIDVSTRYVGSNEDYDCESQTIAHSIVQAAIRRSARQSLISS